MNIQHLSEQEIIRRDKLKELTKLGIDAYPAELFPVNTSAKFIKDNYKGKKIKLIRSLSDLRTYVSPEEFLVSAIWAKPLSL